MVHIVSTSLQGYLTMCSISFAALTGTRLKADAPKTQRWASASMPHPIHLFPEIIIVGMANSSQIDRDVIIHKGVQS